MKNRVPIISDLLEYTYGIYEGYTESLQSYKRSKNQPNTSLEVPRAYQTRNIPLNKRYSSFSGTVTQFKDGDSFEIITTTGPRQVRIYGIDAPESHQEAGSLCRKALIAMLNKKRVSCSLIDVDNYSRDVCTVSCEGQDIGSRMIMHGFAWKAPNISNKQIANKYNQLEKKARQRRKGIWSELKYHKETPWSFRKSNPKQNNINI